MKFTVLSALLSSAYACTADTDCTASEFCGLVADDTCAVDAESCPDVAGCVA